MKINKRAVNKLIKEGYISVQKHPYAELYIYNYTPRTQYEQHWNKWTMICRGLICNKAGEVLYRPFKKIFNYEEHVAKKRRLPKCGFEIQAKFDGSLGILYEVDGQVCVATRGSFKSEQAIHATATLRRKYPNIKLIPGITILVEIIYPENRIVVDYGKTDDLIFLAALDNETGLDRNNHWYIDGMPSTHRWGGGLLRRDIKNLTATDRDNQEGYVIRFFNGLRLKMKFKEYKRLHWLITSVNSVTIWELLKDGTGVEDILDHVPDEFYEWVKETSSKISYQHKEILWVTALEYLEVAKMAYQKKTPREIAERIKESAFPSVLFAYRNDWKLDRIKQLVWKIIKPEASKPFKTPIDL